MKIYVINLLRSQDRLKRMERLLAARGLFFTHIEAIDNFFIDESVCTKVNSVNLWPQPLTNGEIACFLSHKKALKQLIADQEPYGVIFEDDVLLGAGSKELLASSDWLPQDTQIIKLETQSKKVWLGRPQAIGIQNFYLAQLKSDHILTAAYLISREAAIQLVDLMEKMSAPFDHFLFNFSLNIVSKFNVLQLDPAIAIQTDLSSTLDEERNMIRYKEKAQRTFWGTMCRERRRVFQRSAKGLWGMKINLFSDEQWKRVPFSGFPYTIQNKAE